MPEPNQSAKREKLFEKAKKHWEESERGTGGLRCLGFADFKALTNTHRRELLTQPTILTSDGEESCVVMTLDDYFAFIAPTVNPLKTPLMKRVEGKLFREVV